MAEMKTSWSKENDVDDYVKDKLRNLGLEKGKDFFEKDGSDYLKDALKGYSKTDKKSGVGVPDFVLEKYTYTDHHESYPCPVFIESKFSLTKLEALNGDVLKTDEKSIKIMPLMVPCTMQEEPLLVVNIDKPLLSVLQGIIKKMLKSRLF